MGKTYLFNENKNTYMLGPMRSIIESSIFSRKLIPCENKNIDSL